MERSVGEFRLADSFRIEARFWIVLWLTVLSYSWAVVCNAHVPEGRVAQLFADYLMLSMRLMLLVTAISAARLLFRGSREGARSPTAMLRNAITAGWRRDRLLSVVFPPLLFAVLVASFNIYKQTILAHIDFRYDGILAWMGRGLFFGHTPWTVSHHLLGPWATYVLDKLYHAWFLPMSVGIIACAFVPAQWRHLRMRYLITYVLVWIVLGSFVAGVFPAAGPFFTAFADPGSDFSGLLLRLQAEQDILQIGHPALRLTSLDVQHGLLALYNKGQLAMGGGISAMPSMHIALATLFAFAAFHISRTAGAIATVYALLIWIASFHLAWHYAIDGPVAAVFTWGLWRFAGRLTDIIESGAMTGLTIKRQPVPVGSC